MGKPTSQHGPVEDAHELWWILDTLALPFEDIWRRLPSRLDPVWLDVGNVEIDSDRPLEILILVMTASLEQGCRFSLDQDELDDLFELWILLEYYALGQDHLFVKPSRKGQGTFRLHESFEIWNIAARLGRAVLARPTAAAWRHDDFSFEDLLTRHTLPLHVPPRSRPVANPVSRDRKPADADAHLTEERWSVCLQLFARGHEDLWLRILDQLPEEEFSGALRRMAQGLVRAADGWLGAHPAIAPPAESSGVRASRELAALVHWFVSRRNDAFEMPEEAVSEVPLVIWKTVQRLCRAVLASGEVPRVAWENLSLRDLL